MSNDTIQQAYADYISLDEVGQRGVDRTLSGHFNDDVTASGDSAKAAKAAKKAVDAAEKLLVKAAADINKTAGQFMAPAVLVAFRNDMNKVLDKIKR